MPLVSRRVAGSLAEVLGLVRSAQPMASGQPAAPVSVGVAIVDEDVVLARGADVAGDACLAAALGDTSGQRHALRVLEQTPDGKISGPEPVLVIAYPASRLNMTVADVMWASGLSAISWRVSFLLLPKFFLTGTIPSRPSTLIRPSIDSTKWP